MSAAPSEAAAAKPQVEKKANAPKAGKSKDAGSSYPLEVTSFCSVCRIQKLTALHKNR